MLEYFLVFLFLLMVSLAAYFLYDRYISRQKKPVTTLYVDALRDLLDGRQEAAFTRLRQVVAEDSNNIDAYLRLGQILREHKRADRALQVHKDLTMRTGLPEETKVEILRQLHEDYQALDDLAMAESACREWISLRSTDREPHIYLLKIQERQGRWDEAYDTAVAILKLEGNKSKKPLARYKYRIAHQLHKKRDFHKARVVYKEALGLNPGLVEAYLAIGDSYCEEERFEDAVNIWRKLIAEAPEQGHRAIDRLKRTLFDLGRYGEIMDICQEILKHSPKNIEARLALADFYYKKGDLDATEEILGQAVEEAPENYEVILQQLRLLHEKGDSRKIDEVFRQIERRREKGGSTPETSSPGSSQVAVS